MFEHLQLLGGLPQGIQLDDGRIHAFSMGTDEDRLAHSAGNVKGNSLWNAMEAGKLQVGRYFKQRDLLLQTPLAKPVTS